MTSKKLSNGVTIPMLGFGVYQIRDAETCRRTVLDAISSGYRLFDTAYVYGNEAAVGQAIRMSGVSREEFFLTTKLWTNSMGYEQTKKAFENSLSALQTDYLDLYLIHEPMGDYYSSWRALEDLYKEGKVRAIGICNMWPDRLLDLCLCAEIKPHLIQMETHPFFQQYKIEPVLREFDITHEAWGPFMEGRENIFNNAILKEIGDHHHKSNAQVILRWLYQRGIVSLSKTVHKERMLENRNIMDFELTPEEMDRIRILDHDRPLILNNRDLEVVRRISPNRM